MISLHLVKSQHTHMHELAARTTMVLLIVGPNPGIYNFLFNELDEHAANILRNPSGWMEAFGDI